MSKDQAAYQDSQALIINDLDDWSDALLRKLGGAGSASERAIAEEQRGIVVLCKLCSLSDCERPHPDRHRDR